MQRVELVFDHDCPNVARARAHLRAALEASGATVEWIEWKSGDPCAPPHVRGLGSPTVLIAGKPVGGIDHRGGPCCRVYDEGGRLSGAPSVEAIVRAMRDGA
jgi:hypothetical protein